MYQLQELLGGECVRVLLPLHLGSFGTNGRSFGHQRSGRTQARLRHRLVNMGSIVLQGYHLLEGQGQFQSSVHMLLGSYRFQLGSVLCHQRLRLLQNARLAASGNDVVACRSPRKVPER